MKFRTFISLALIAGWLLAGAPVKAASAGSDVVKPITGTWLNLPYKDVRNKYTNPQHFDNTDPKLWRAKVSELAKMGIEVLVIMEVANEGKAYYPSDIMLPLYDKAFESPIDAILDEAGKHGMKVFMSTGWAVDQDDDLRKPEIKARQLEIMEEIAAKYKDHKAFYGWYLPVEDCLCPILAQHAVESVNTLVDKARQLTPGKKTMISPYGIGLSEFDNPDYEKQLAQLKVDIIAYQDEVGCLRDRYTLPRLKQNWKRIRDIHDRIGIEMWANCETFTWEEGTNDRESALIPSAYPRLLAQQAAASEGGVDRIISFMFDGIIEDPSSPYRLGQPGWSNDLYSKYMGWRAGDPYWKLMEGAITGRLQNNVPAGTIVKGAPQAIIDGRTGDENPDNEAWQKLGTGYKEVVFDFGKPSKVDNVFVRTLNAHKDGIEPLSKVYVFSSDDGTSYALEAIQDMPLFPNNKWDGWTDGIWLKNVKAKKRFLKVAFSSPGQIYMDEIFINPSIH